MRRVRGQSASEISLVVAVILLVAVAASTTLIPLFENGARELGNRRGPRNGTGEDPDAPRNIATGEDVRNAMLAGVPVIDADIGPPTAPAN